MCGNWNKTFSASINFQRNSEENNGQSIVVSRSQPTEKYQESSSPENEMNSNIQSQVSLSDKLLKISVDMCACCNEPRDGDGIKAGSSLAM